MKFLSHQKRDSALLPKAALWLMNHRNEGYWWSSTKQTAMVIYGLTDYLKATNELNPNLSVTVFVNDVAAMTRKLDAATAIISPELTLDESKLQAGVNHIRVTTSGEGRLYYSARAEYYSGDEKLQKTGTVSLNVLRDYFRLVPGKDGERIVYDTAPLNGPAAAGDILAVRLTVTGIGVEVRDGGGSDSCRDGVHRARQPIPDAEPAAVVGIPVHAARTARRPHGDFPDLVPAGAAHVFLPAEGGEPGRVPGEPGAGAADVPA